ncbi:MAG: C25 family cysteine peptidase [Fidelibacterota bacterium]
MEISLVESSRDRTVLRLEVPGLEISPVDIGGERYVIVSHPDALPLLEKGLPGLPRISTTVAIPPGVAVQVTVLDAEFEEFALGPVAPSRGALPRTEDPHEVPYEFDAFYQTDSWFPSKNIRVSDPFVLRDVRGVTVQFQPVQFNPSGNIIKVATTLTVAVEAKDGTGPGVTLRETGRSVSEDFVHVYERVFLNYATLEWNIRESIEEPGNLVLVVYDEFVDAVEPLAEWKIQKGIPTRIIPLSQIGTSGLEIKGYLRDLYDAGELTYVILVGDAEQVPVIYGSTGAASDPSYVMLDGDDIYPDAFISRISASTVRQVRAQVDKFIAYEKDPVPGDWYHAGVGVASNEGYDVPPDYLADWERAETLRSMLLDYTYTRVDQIYDPGASLTSLVNAINNGRSILIYLGHGSGTSWATTWFDTSDASRLKNFGMLPFIVDVSSFNGKWPGQTSLAEAFLRNPDGGAVGMFSSSVSPSWVPPTVMQKKVIELLVGEQRHTMGSLALLGSMLTVEAYGGNTEGVAIVEEYNLFGDCTLPMRTSTPTRLTVHHDPVVPVGTSRMTVSADVSGAMWD